METDFNCSTNLQGPPISKASIFERQMCRLFVLYWLTNCVVESPGSVMQLVNSHLVFRQHLKAFRSNLYRTEPREGMDPRSFVHTSQIFYRELENVINRGLYRKNPNKSFYSVYKMQDLLIQQNGFIYLRGFKFDLRFITQEEELGTYYSKFDPTFTNYLKEQINFIPTALKD